MQEEPFGPLGAPGSRVASPWRSRRGALASHEYGLGCPARCRGGCCPSDSSSANAGSTHPACARCAPNRTRRLGGVAFLLCVRAFGVDDTLATLLVTLGLTPCMRMPQFDERIERSVVLQANPVAVKSLARPSHPLIPPDVLAYLADERRAQSSQPLDQACDSNLVIGHAPLLACRWTAMSKISLATSIPIKISLRGIALPGCSRLAHDSPTLQIRAPQAPELFELEGQDVTASYRTSSDPGSHSLSRPPAFVLSFPEDRTNIQGSGMIDPATMNTLRQFRAGVYDCFGTGRLAPTSARPAALLQLHHAQYQADRCCATRVGGVANAQLGKRDATHCSNCWTLPRWQALCRRWRM